MIYLGDLIHCTNIPIQYQERFLCFLLNFVRASTSRRATVCLETDSDNMLLASLVTSTAVLRTPLEIGLEMVDQFFVHLSDDLLYCCIDKEVLLVVLEDAGSSTLGDVELPSDLSSRMVSLEKLNGSVELVLRNRFHG